MKKKNIIYIMLIIIVCMCVGNSVFAQCSCGGTGVNIKYSSNNSSTHTAKVYCSKCGKYLYQSQGSHSFSSNWSRTKEPTCTETGIERCYCSVCGGNKSRSVSTKPHSWSDWKTNTTEHWKTCGSCGTTGSKGNHVDKDINGYCDTCDYLMAIPGSATISDDVAVKVGSGAEFSITVTKGTEPITYQWYYNTSDSTEGGTKIDGEITTSISISTTTEEMNGRYYYCGMKNKAGEHFSPTSKLTVYYPFTIGTHPDSFNLKKGQTATFSVGIGKHGSPDEYNYQWYIASTADGEGNRIAGATDSSYSVTPETNVHEAYYYCVVDNEQYEATSNRAKLVADVTVPVITMGTFNQDLIINKDVTLTIPFTVTDTGEGYTENGSNFTKEDFVIKTDGVENTNVNKNLVYNSSSGNEHSYTLTISNMTGNGKLSLEVPAGLVEDDFHNTNETSIFTTNVIVDNIAPVVSFESVISGVNDKYANSEKTVVISLSITEKVGIETTEFEDEDIIVKVGGSTLGEELSKELRYSRKEGNKYFYELTLKNLTGDGELVLDINADRMRDLANNPNVYTSLSVLSSSNEKVLIDNTKPVIQSLITKFDSYTSSRDYPDSLEAEHKNWAKENIYVQINATDEQKIDYYTKSEDNITHVPTPYQYVIDESINTEMIYRVYDMAGNYSEVRREIKLDKIHPKLPALLLTEQRENGAAYIFNEEEPSSKTIYVKPNPATVVDYGDVQSGINIDDPNYPYTFYYKIKRYKDIDKTVEMGDTVRYEYTDVAILRDSGYYVIEAFMSDIAGNIAFTYDVNGNKVEKVTYEVYINKGVENTIRIKNINDVGSGISRVIINIYDEDGNEAISEIVIDDPYKEIVKNVRLREGKFDVKVTLIDKVGNTKVKTATITNIF